VRWNPAWQQVYAGNLERLLHVQRWPQMTKMNGIESTAEDTDHGFY
jgi:hypothetical protein